MGNLIGNRFEVGELLGQGGMGTVYRGVDTQTGQPVAIKLLRPELVASNPGLLERFAREGEALRRLNHPNIVKMLAAFDEGNQHYLVMEYVSGGSLDELLEREKQLPVERVLYIALELADALTRAHHMKIIHRDLKPANVLIAEDGTPRLTDFGIARLSDQSRMTESGAVYGTFAYLSPEACQGEALDARADLWAFGVMLYEMLAGRRPFDEDNMAATLTAILTRDPRDVRTFRPDVPLALAVLIGRMLVKDRNGRIASARQVGAELEAILHGDITPRTGAPSRFGTTPTSTAPPELEGETVMGATPTPTVERASAQPRSRRAILVAGIVLLMVVTLVVVFTVNRGAATPATPPVSTIQPVAQGEYMVLVAPFEAVKTGERDVARFVADDLKQHLEVEAPFSNLRVRQYPNVIKTDDEARAVAEGVGASVVVWGNYTADTINVNVQVGSLAAFKNNPFGRDVLERTANVRVQMTDETKQSVAPVVIGVLGVLQNADGNAFEWWRDLAVLDQIQANGAEIVGNGVAANVHRYFAAYLSDTKTALTAMDAALALDEGNGILHSFRSLANFHEGRFDEAKADAQTAQRVSDKWAIPMYLLANDYMLRTTFGREVGNTDLDYYNQIIVLDPQDWFPVFFRGTIYYESEKFDLANTDFQQAMRLAPGANFPHVFAVLIALREGRLADAAALSDTIVKNFPDPGFMRRIVTIFGRRLSLGFGGIGNYLSAFGNLMLERYDDALKSIPTGFEGGTGSEWDLIRGVVECNLGDYASAEEAYIRGLTFGGLAFTARSAPDFTLFHLLLVEAHLKQGKNADVLKDVSNIQKSKQADIYAPFAVAVLKTEFGCKDLFDSGKIQQIIQKYGNLKAADISAAITAVPTATP
jgi:tetratricopeptide (TPR) repeat protein/predicted Ser/Thr protein kinase